MMSKAILILTFIIFSFTLDSAELLIEWARPLKKNLVGVNKRELGGISSFGNNILVTTRCGKMHLFSHRGELKKTAVFNGDFYFHLFLLMIMNLLFRYQILYLCLIKILTKCGAFQVTHR